MYSALSSEIAQNIVNRTMQILPYNVNVMDKEGKIIGSGDQKRISMRHEVAIEVIHKKQSIEIKSEDALLWGGVKEGINLPIIISDEIVGVVGITGEVGKIRGYGELVKMSAEMIIEQSILEKELQLDERINREVISQLITKEHKHDTLFYKKIKILRLNLYEPRVAIVIKGNTDELKLLNRLTAVLEELIEENDLYTTLFTGEIVILKKINEINGIWNRKQTLQVLKIWLTKLDKLEMKVSVSMGGFYNHHTEWWKSYEEARDALFIGEKLQIKQRIFQFQEVSLYVLLSKMLPVIKENPIFKCYEDLILKDRTLELQNTLSSYIKNNGNSSQTADELYVHRNTIQYRVNKIYQITGKNPYVYSDLFELHLSLIADKLDK
ncbi:sugar diacid recognition domain-containing protein [Carnobacterium mobile]|uniref:sugar diacid recognition domain-containing protein n=1 Tax=Carnobacterium mobile TaxID=2750 RepID=UPI0005505079|nr:sugar diacid recognition domain-containing protein [Carnobacterium mobile]